jgi:hypothetical protein
MTKIKGGKKVEMVGDAMYRRADRWHKNLTLQDWLDIAKEVSLTVEKAMEIAWENGFLYLLPCNHHITDDSMVLTCAEEAMGRIGTHFGDLAAETVVELRSAKRRGYDRVFVPALRTDVVWYEGNNCKDLCRVRVPEWMCGYTWLIDEMLMRCKVFAR